MAARRALPTRALSLAASPIKPTSEKGAVRCGGLYGRPRPMVSCILVAFRTRLWYVAR